jgi:hypothetical protein
MDKLQEHIITENKKIKDDTEWQLQTENIRTAKQKIITVEVIHLK